jgi:hypothetical protein
MEVFFPSAFKIVRHMGAHIFSVHRCTCIMHWCVCDIIEEPMPIRYFECINANYLLLHTGLNHLLFHINVYISLHIIKTV